MNFYLKKLLSSWLRSEIYLDHASTTLLDHEVLSVMKKIFTKKYGNPGGLYQLGVTTKTCIKESRNTVAQLINAQSTQIIFTRGGTESNNLALLGGIQKFQTQFPSIIPHVITSTIEHDSVLATLRHLESKNQIQVTYVACNTEGIVAVDDIKKSLRPETMLVSIMYANNEIGTIQPIKEIAKLLRWWKKHNLSMFSSSPPATFDNRATDIQVYPLLHTDAIQAANYCDTNVLRLGVDMMTLSGSKIYGPKSSGMLFIKNKDWLNPILFGGGQEFGLRSGTEDVAQVIGFAKALEIAQHKKDQEVTRLTVLRDFLIHQLLADDRIRLNGSMIDRLPNNINITVSGYSAESLVIQLAAHGFSVASKSACQSDNDEESHVIAALRAAKFAKKSLPNQSTNTEEGSLRITLGRGTTKSQIVRFHRVLRKILDNIY